MARGLIESRPESPPPRVRPSLAVRWGRWVARRRWWVLSVGLSMDYEVFLMSRMRILPRIRLQ